MFILMGLNVGVGRSYYHDLWNFPEKMAEAGTIRKSDRDLVLLTDDGDEAIHYISACVAANYTIRKRKRRWWLFEKR